MTDASGQSSNRLRAAWIAGAVLIFAIVAISPFLRSPKVETPAVTKPAVFAGDPAAVERGSALFAAQCASCHGADGKGDGPLAATLNPKPIDFTNPVHRGHTDADLENWISNGLAGSEMPAFSATLSSAEIDDLIVFIRSLQAMVAADVNVDIPDPAECTIAPTSPEFFKPGGTITPKPAPTRAPEVGPDTFPWPQGEPASQEEIDGITRTIREFHACANAGDYPRRLSLYTDRAIRPQFDALDAAGWESTLAFAATPPAVVPEGDRGWIASIAAVRRVPDGRVGAYVAAVDPVNHPHQINAVVIFAKVGDRWLIDEIHEDPTANMGISVTPAPGSDVPVAGLNTPVTSSGLVVTMIDAPNTYGMGTFAFEITRAGGDPVTGASVELAIEMPGMDMGVQVVTAEGSGDGRYRAEVPMGMPGAWQVDVLIARDGEADLQFRFHFEIE